MTSKQNKAEKQDQNRTTYLLSLVDENALKRFTKKRAEKLAKIILWGDETVFVKAIDTSKSGIAYADRFIAIADYLASAGIKETKDLWGRSGYSCKRDLLSVIAGLAKISLDPVSQNARVIVYNQAFGTVAKAYKYNRKAKELWVTFGADGMIDSVRLDSSVVYPDKTQAAFEWSYVSDNTKQILIDQLIAGAKVELPKF